MKVLFWQLLNQNIVVQCKEQFLELPKAATEAVVSDAELRKNIADNFSSAPFKTRSFDLIGANCFDSVEVDRL